MVVVERLRDKLTWDVGVNGKGLLRSTDAAVLVVLEPAFWTASSSLRLISSWAAAPEVGFLAADKFVLVSEAWFDLVLNFSGNKEIDCCSGFSTMRDGTGLWSKPPGDTELRSSPHPPTLLLIG